MNLIPEGLSQETTYHLLMHWHWYCLLASICISVQKNLCLWSCYPFHSAQFVKIRIKRWLSQQQKWQHMIKEGWRKYFHYRQLIVNIYGILSSNKELAFFDSSFCTDSKWNPFIADVPISGTALNVLLYNKFRNCVKHKSLYWMFRRIP